VVLAIARAQIARGDQVWVVTLDEETARPFREAGAVVVRPPLWLHGLSPLDVVPLVYLWWLCLREKFDLVATHTSKGGFLGRLAAWAARVPCGTGLPACRPHIVHYVHGFTFHQLSHPLVVRFQVILERLASHWCDRIISVAEHYRRAMLELKIAPADKVCTVINGIDLEMFQGVDHAAARRRLDYDDREKIIGAVGRVVPVKGFQYAIEAMPAVVRRHPTARLVIAGEGSMEAELKQRVRQLDMDEHVTFLGFRSDTPDLLAACDVFIQPSLREGMSIVLIEGMAAGKAIVATDIWGNQEMIFDRVNGLLVPPAEPAPMADAIATLLDDPELARKLARRARQDAYAHYTEAKMVEGNLEAYDRVCGRQPAVATEAELAVGHAER